MWTYLLRWDNWMALVPAWDTVKADHHDECNQRKRCMGCHHVREGDIGRHRIGLRSSISFFELLSQRFFLLQCICVLPWKWPSKSGGWSWYRRWSRGGINGRGWGSIGVLTRESGRVLRFIFPSEPFFLRTMCHNVAAPSSRLEWWQSIGKRWWRVSLQFRLLLFGSRVLRYGGLRWQRSYAASSLHLLTILCVDSLGIHMGTRKFRATAGGGLRFRIGVASRRLKN